MKKLIILVAFFIASISFGQSYETAIADSGSSSFASVTPGIGKYVVGVDLPALDSGVDTLWLVSNSKVVWYNGAKYVVPVDVAGCRVIFNEDVTKFLEDVQVVLESAQSEADTLTYIYNK